MEPVVQNRFDHADNRPLDDAIADCRNAQRSGFVRSSRFGNVNAPNRAGAICLGLDFSGELACFRLQMLLEGLAALPINPR